MIAATNEARIVKVESKRKRQHQDQPDTDTRLSTGLVYNLLQISASHPLSMPTLSPIAASPPKTAMSHVADPTLAEQGRLNLEIAEKRMGALLKIRDRFAQEKIVENRFSVVEIEVRKNLFQFFLSLQCEGTGVTYALSHLKRFLYVTGPNVDKCEDQSRFRVYR